MSRKSSGGFGLIESMVTIAVLAILISIAVPSYQQMIQNGRTRTIAESFRSGIGLARAEAMRRNAPVSFRVVSAGCTASTNGTSWVVFTGTNCTDNTTIQRFEGASAGTGVTVASDRTDLVFNGVGMVASAATASRITQIDFSNTLPVAQRRPLRITATAGGLTRLCDPGVTNTNDPRGC